MVHDEVFDGPAGRDLWFLENRVPTLGEVRGKIVLFSRFGGNGAGWEGGLEGIGIHPTNWPDSSPEVFYWNCKETLVRTHDWYVCLFCVLGLSDYGKQVRHPILPFDP